MSQREHVAALKGLLHAGPDGRRLHSVPGCWDGLTALLVERAGFPITFLSGGALSMGRYGSPDMGLVTASEVAQAVAVIRDRIAIPLSFSMNCNPDWINSTTCMAGVWCRCSCRRGTA